MLIDVVVTKATGELLLLNIKTIHEDPNQPHIEFNDESIVNLSKKIAAGSVKSPISVRPHPTIEGE